MKLQMNRSIRVIVFVFTGLAIGGCQSQKQHHAIIEGESGQQFAVCSKCFDEIQKVRSTGGPRGGLTTNRKIRVHMCEECKTEMSIYSDQDGALIVKCSKCAPTGLPCDKCRPRQATGS